ncbi:MAG: tRNA pseudouridine(55) synthase TruB [Candidatus Saccharimonadia bacterium]
MDGILLINKPEGISSFDCIRILRKNLTFKKIGHAGTLDPSASGLMIMLLGKACKSADQYSKLDKTYDAVVRLGVRSDTGDREGQLTESATESVVPTQSTVMQVLNSFLGEITQIPPKYSAIKISGQEAYKRARRGEDFEMPKRQVTIYGVRLKSYNYPDLHIEIDCSSGTYIRTLAQDIGEQLGTGGYLLKLVRTRIGKMTINGAVDLDKATPDSLPGILGGYFP